MRTTIDLTDELLRQAKRRAADDGVPLREVVEHALRAHLSRSTGPRGRYRLSWVTKRGVIQPGVRLDDRDALFDLMEERS